MKSFLFMRFAVGALAIVIPCLGQFNPDQIAEAQKEAAARVAEAAKAPTPRSAQGHPDLTGYWAPPARSPFGGGGTATLDGKVAVVPISEFAETRGNAANVARRAADTASRPAYKPEFSAKAKDNFERASYLDPSFRCEPDGVPRIGAPTEIVQTPSALYFLYANHNIYRVIPTDGRPHDKDADNLPNGDSIGRWEGDTLVVDVTKLSEDTWLDGDGSFHTENMHVVERLTRQGNTINYSVVVEDPAVFARPFTGRPRTLILGKPGEHAGQDYPCLDMDREHLQTNLRH
jgi:hypothetical protein